MPGGRLPGRFLDSASWQPRSRRRSASRSPCPPGRSATVIGVIAFAWAFVAARQAVLWVFIALFLAIVLQTPVTWLEERAGMKRGNAAMLVVLGLVALPRRARLPARQPVRRRGARPDRGPADDRRADPGLRPLPAARPADRHRREAPAEGRVPRVGPPLQARRRVRGRRPDLRLRARRDHDHRS